MDFTVEATPQMQADDRYVYLPFQVALGTTSIGVEIDFDAPLGVIDLGCEGPSGWRGWSGGARREFTISEDQATPGYTPGPIEPGEWAVVLGLHLLRAPVVKIHVRVSMPSEVALPEAPAAPSPTTALETPRGSARKLPAPDGLTWFAGDFHSHTLHSDGSQTVEQVAALGAELGLDFLAITDHNTTSAHRYLEDVGREYGITLIPGQEVTSHRGHANAFGYIDWIDFREPAAQWVNQVHEAGGLISINHPIDADCSWLDPLPVPPDAVELWHSSWYRALDDDGIFSWLARGDRSLPIIGGSDFHQPGAAHRPGTPTTWVAAEETTVDCLLAAMKAGRTSISGYVTIKDKETGGPVDMRVATESTVVITPEVLQCPVLLRNEPGELLALNAQGLTLTDFFGDRRIISSPECRISAPAERGPYALMLPDRKVMALSL